MQDITLHCLIGRGFIMMLEDLTLKTEDGVMRIILQGGDHLYTQCEGT